MNDATEIQQLRREIERMLAAALKKDTNHESELQRRDEAHLAETGRRDHLHINELGRRDQLHLDEMASRDTAIETRDMIGQAKGVIMATIGSTADESVPALEVVVPTREPQAGRGRHRNRRTATARAPRRLIDRVPIARSALVLPSAKAGAY